VVSTITFNSTFVNKPKKPFQSPGTHQRTARLPVRHVIPLFCFRPGLGTGERLQKALRVADPAENAALGLDHLERGLLELREVRADAILEHQAVVAAVVRLAHCRVDADLGRHAADHELANAAVVQQRIEVGRVERALAGLVDYRLAWRGLERIDDVVPILAAHEDAAHRARVADAVLQPPAQLLVERQIGEVGAMAFARMHDEHAFAARLEHLARRPIALRSSETSLPSASPNPPGSTKSRCMSMMTSAQLARSKLNSYGSALTLRIETPRANGTSDHFGRKQVFELLLRHRRLKRNPCISWQRSSRSSRACSSVSTPSATIVMFSALPSEIIAATMLASSAFSVIWR
jgi:hypothetical protein